MISERRLVLLIASVQFINVLDFMMVMPLGPDFAQGLGIANSHIGIVAGSYTLAAAVSGLAAANFLDRFDRRHVLIVTLCGLVLGTALGGLAVDTTTMILSRVVAGAFGGPATSVALAIVADLVPAPRRGRALSAVMASFAVASVVGVPIGLELAQWGGWRMPFWAISVAGMVIAVAVRWLLPPLRSHLAPSSGNGGADPTTAGGVRRRQPSIGEFVRAPNVALSLGTCVCLMVPLFSLVPNLSAYWQYNLGYPRADMGKLYLVGGLLSFATMRLAGVLVDKVGASVSFIISLFFYIPSLLVIALPRPEVPAMLLFVTFMVSTTFRSVPYQTLVSRVPPPEHRARFMSLLSFTQHLSSAAGAGLASLILTSDATTGALHGMESLAVAAIVLGVGILLPVRVLEKRAMLSGR